MKMSGGLGFPGGSDGKEPTCNSGDSDSIPGLGRSPGGGHGNPLQYSCLENPHGQTSLVGYSPWGRKGSDTTERLTHVQQLAYMADPIEGDSHLLGLVRTHLFCYILSNWFTTPTLV